MVIPVRCLLFASGNAGKFTEISLVCKSFDVRALAPKDLESPSIRHELGVEPQGPAPEVQETASTYHGNARLKADAFHAWSGLPSLADDTGLEVDALDGRPGVHSARYAGPRQNPGENIRKLLGEINESDHLRQKGRRARFVCQLALKLGENRYLEAHGELMGEIGFAPKGQGGFGYDSIFIVQGFSQTLAELKEKRIHVKTHRIAALEKLLAELTIRH